jgi:hypothetical protein
VSEMIIPRSMAIVVILLLGGFLLSMFGTLRAKAKRPKYQRLGGAAVRNGMPTITSYQDSAAVYALPAKGKTDVTYCVIDGRMVDD